MNTKNFRYVFFTLIAIAITLTACVGAPATVEATAAPPTPPAPEENDLGEYTKEAVNAAREICQNLPVWLQYDRRAIGHEIYPTENTGQIEDGQTEVTYVTSALVYINDRRVEFKPDGVEVYQFGRDEYGVPKNFVYELYPEPYIDRALEILDGDVAPVIITAIWRWQVTMTAEQAAARGYSPFDRWSWRVVDAKCSRLEAAMPKSTPVQFRPIQSN